MANKINDNLFGITFMFYLQGLPVMILALTSIDNYMGMVKQLVMSLCGILKSK